MRSKCLLLFSISESIDEPEYDVNSPHLAAIL
jgi:hypothetical protein